MTQAQTITSDTSTSSRHPLQSKWSWWYFDRYNRTTTTTTATTTPADAAPETPEDSSSSSSSDSGSGMDSGAIVPPPQRCETEPYDALWSKLCTFDTLEGFVRSYAHVKRPSSIQIANLSLFRGEEPPTWESYPNGGQWIVEMRKNGPLLDRLWEQLIFSVIGEEFEQPDLVGVSLSIRPFVDILSIWQTDASNTRAKNAICDKMKTILHLGPQVIVQYKSNKQSLIDGRSFLHAKAYVVGGEQQNKSGGRSRRNSSAVRRSRRNSSAVAADVKNKPAQKVDSASDSDTSAPNVNTGSAEKLSTEAPTEKKVEVESDKPQQ